MRNILLVAFGFVLGSLITIVGTRTWNEQESAKASEIDRMLSSALMPTACFQFPNSFYGRQEPENLCVWIEDEVWQDGGCWKMKDKDLCWTGNGWRYHE